MTETATVLVTIDDERQAWFRCPHCDRKIRFRNAYPYGFAFRRCGGCQWVWGNVDAQRSGEIGPRVDDLAPGDSRSVAVVSSGEPVR
jgi:hypothetical protein